MKTLTTLLLITLVSCITLQTTAQPTSQNLKRPVLTSPQKEALRASTSDRIRFEVQLVDSLLEWTSSLECTYRVAGFLSACNESLLINRTHLLAVTFQGNTKYLKIHLKDRLLEILTDSDLDYLFYIKEDQWEIWLDRFIEWIPKEEVLSPLEVKSFPVTYNPMKQFSYYGKENQ